MAEIEWTVATSALHCCTIQCFLCCYFRFSRSRIKVIFMSLRVALINFLNVLHLYIIALQWRLSFFFVKPSPVLLALKLIKKSERHSKHFDAMQFSGDHHYFHSIKPPTMPNVDAILMKLSSSSISTKNVMKFYAKQWHNKSRSFEA